MPFKRIKAEWTIGITKITITREISNELAYGDKSCHSIYLNDNKYMYYNTSDSGISDVKDKWIEYWESWIKMVWKKPIVLTSYKENEDE